ncbi:MAG: hypothetical protein IPP05_22310 [Cytophagaceae bacterium]|nr:hypothetical protein [Cytophagaceae bacterium]
MELTTQIQRQEIEKIIELELIKRGISVSITVKEVTQRLKLTSSSFQTTPVLFKEIKIIDFGSYVTEKGKVIEVGVSVSAYYEHFDGGSNVVKLFSITINCFDDEARLIKCI